MKITEILFIIGVTLFLIIVFGFAAYFGIKTAYDFNEYSKFCKHNTNLCYCDIFDGCSFKLSHSYSTSYTNGELINNSTNSNVKELCALAKKLNDKEMMFDAECK